jgi:hypothetical protein
MGNRKQKKTLRSAARKLSNEQLLATEEYMVGRLDDGDKLNEMEKYTLKSLGKEFKKRNKQTIGTGK